uniref:Triadin-like isoform X1 n=1 Tax=Cicer arietinum TaxID=3827 RepID=A0A3Q7YCN1_CICAR|nr:triadin-like isoform X1 [Cicer arietinum]
MMKINAFILCFFCGLFLLSLVASETSKDGYAKDSKKNVVLDKFDGSRRPSDIEPYDPNKPNEGNKTSDERKKEKKAKKKEKEKEIKNHGKGPGKGPKTGKGQGNRQKGQSQGKGKGKGNDRQNKPKDPKIHLKTRCIIYISCLCIISCKKMYKIKHTR